MPDTSTPAAIADAATGEIRLTINGAEYRFKPPTLGQYRKLDEAIAARVAQAEAERAARPEDYEPTFDDQWAPRLDDFAWWRTAYELCGEGRKAEFPPDDDLPIWLTSDLASQAMIHWTRFPTQALGGPSLGAISKLLELAPSAPAANGVSG